MFWQNSGIGRNDGTRRAPRYSDVQGRTCQFTWKFDFIQLKEVESMGQLSFRKFPFQDTLAIFSSKSSALLSCASYSSSWQWRLHLSGSLSAVLTVTKNVAAQQLRRYTETAAITSQWLGTKKQQRLHPADVMLSGQPAPQLLHHVYLRGVSTTIQTAKNP